MDYTSSQRHSDQKLLDRRVIVMIDDPRLDGIHNPIQSTCTPNELLDTYGYHVMFNWLINNDSRYVDLDHYERIYNEGRKDRYVIIDAESKKPLDLMGLMRVICRLYGIYDRRINGVIRHPTSNTWSRSSRRGIRAYRRLPVVARLRESYATDQEELEPPVRKSYILKLRLTWGTPRSDFWDRNWKGYRKTRYKLIKPSVE